MLMVVVSLLPLGFYTEHIWAHRWTREIKQLRYADEEDLKLVYAVEREPRFWWGGEEHSRVVFLTGYPEGAEPAQSSDRFVVERKIDVGGNNRTARLWGVCVSVSVAGLTTDLYPNGTPHRQYGHTADGKVVEAYYPPWPAPMPLTW